MQYAVNVNNITTSLFSLNVLINNLADLAPASSTSSHRPMHQRYHAPTRQVQVDAYSHNTASTCNL